MREIEFRGKSTNIGEWEYGYYLYVEEQNKHYILTGKLKNYPVDYVHPALTVQGFEWFDIKEETVGQFTGLRDKNGVKIYEGDIVKIGAGVGEEKAIVRYECNKCRFIMHTVGKEHDYSFVRNNGVDHLNGVEVIGNIYDTPGLLEDKA